MTAEQASGGPSAAGQGASSSDRARWIAIGCARLVMALSALACVPLALMSGQQGDVSFAFGLLAASLPSVVVLLLLRTTSMDAALMAGAAALDAVIVVSVWAGEAHPGLVFLTAAAAAEAVLLGVGARLGQTLVLLLAGALFAGAPLLLARADGAPAVTAVLASATLIQVAVLMIFLLRRQPATDERPAVAEARRARLLRLLREVAIVVDRAGQALDIAGDSQPALGLPAAELLGRGLAQRVHVADRPTFLKALSDAAVSGVGSDMKLRFRVETTGRADYRWVECRCVPDHPGATELAVVLRDITAAEAERSGFVKADSLRQAATRSRGLFISSLSHEVRTPLNAVIGFSDMLASSGTDLSDEMVRDYGRIINASGKQLLKLVASTIDLIRLDSGTYEINPEAFGMAGLIDACIDEFAEEALAAGIGIERDIPPSLRDIVADRRAAKQIIGHVLGNALKFSQPGSAVRIGVEQDAEALVVTVRDRGKGIAPEHLASLADPFFQADGSYDRLTSGAGLGIAVVSRLMALLGGTIEIASTVGEGTDVALRFPVETSPTEVAAVTIFAGPRRNSAPDIGPAVPQRRSA